MIIMDIEASGLSEESYPIQVALYDTKTDASEVFYIKPISKWTYWNQEAQDIHNIPRELILESGISVVEAVRRIEAFMATRNEVTMYCDAPSYDGFWMNKLFYEADVSSTDLSIRHVYEVCEYREEAEHLAEIMSLQERPHDALEDCKMIWDAVQKVLYQ